MALPADYQSRTAGEKLELLWAEASSNPYSLDALPKRVPSVWERRKLFSVDFNRVSFDHASDEMPAGRDKLVHRYGTTAKVELEVDDAHGFTGIFAAGGPAILRFSDAVGGGTLPALALKFLVDGKASLNFLALPLQRRDPDDNDPLSGAYANSTPPPKELGATAVGIAFQRTANALGGTRLYAVYLPLHHLAQMTRDGRPVAAARVPDRLELHGTQAARAAMTEHRDWRRSLASLPAGTRLFDLKIAPKIDEPALAFGSVTLTSEFVASRYGDERLFFQHDVGPTK